MTEFLDADTVRRMRAIAREQEEWLNAEALKALVGVEAFVAEVRAADQGLASAAALWALIDARLAAWRAEAETLRRG